MTSSIIQKSVGLIDYLKSKNRLEKICSCCERRMFPLEDFDLLKSYIVVSSRKHDISLMRLKEDGKYHYEVEPDKYKWTLIGLHSSNGKVCYRSVCWDCFFRNLRERASDGKHLIPCNTKPNSWWMRVIRGEEAYPSGKASAIGRYWADLMFTELSEDELNSLSNRFDTASRSSFIRRYGKEEGTRRYEEYVKFHSNKNKLEYKRDKLGWSREQYDEFNKSRSVTLELCIKKHGEELGRKIFSEYCEKQAYAGCALEYFVEKHGEEEGKRKYEELNKKKTLKEETFINKYGEEKGRSAWKAYLLKREQVSNISMVSQRLFDEILTRIPSSQYGKVKYASFGGEQCIQGRNSYMFPDFLYDNKKIIEFNGDYWHKNPKIYAETDETRLTWKHDAERKSELESLGYEVLVVWERDYYDNEEAVVQGCLKFLGY